MAGTSLGSWLVIAIWLEPPTDVATLLGMLGPLTMAGGTWLLTERTYRRNPDRVTAMMMVGFGAKMVFVGVYLTVMLRVLAVEPVPFVASFTSYFILLYAIEALYLKRLFAGGFDATHRKPGL